MNQNLFDYREDAPHFTFYISDHITKEEECPFGSSISKLFKFSSSSKKHKYILMVTWCQKTRDQPIIMSHRYISILVTSQPFISWSHLFSPNTLFFVI